MNAPGPIKSRDARVLPASRTTKDYQASSLSSVFTYGAPLLDLQDAVRSPAYSNPLRRIFLWTVLPSMPGEARGEGITPDVPVPPMRLHPLAPDAKCPTCDGDLVFVRVRGRLDLYHCVAGGQCRCRVVHYRKPTIKACGYSVLYGFEGFGKWTACAETATKEK
jgi:hypothetical protein